MASGNAEPNWAWLGLLKWSLSYTDGTSDNKDVSPMSKEDREFLEEVMKDGIIDEGKRMNHILTELTNGIQSLKDGGDVVPKSVNEEEMVEYLEELRDIVEQIDYAKAFAAMGGLTFLLGCASEPTQVIPTNIKSHCLGVLATLCQNNPSVQYNLLELGAMKTLVTLYVSSSQIQIQPKVVQTLSCMIRNHAMAEHIFCQDEMSIQVLESGLGLTSTTTTSALQKRCLFFLQALVTSDTADEKRLQTLTPCLNFVVTKFLTCDNVELREMTLSMVIRLFQHKEHAQTLTHHTNLLQTIGTQRISTIQSLTGEELDFAQEELHHWQTLQSLLAKK